MPLRLDFAPALALLLLLPLLVRLGWPRRRHCLPACCWTALGLRLAGVTLLTVALRFLSLQVARRERKRGLCGDRRQPDAEVRPRRSPIGVPTRRTGPAARTNSQRARPRRRPAGSGSALWTRRRSAKTIWPRSAGAGADLSGRRGQRAGHKLQAAMAAGPRATPRAAARAASCCSPDGWKPSRTPTPRSCRSKRRASTSTPWSGRHPAAGPGRRSRGRARCGARSRAGGSVHCRVQRHCHRGHGTVVGGHDFRGQRIVSLEPW